MTSIFYVFAHWLLKMNMLKIFQALINSTLYFHLYGYSAFYQCEDRDLNVDKEANGIIFFFFELHTNQDISGRGNLS